ncbi:hypothetical protein P7K49_011277 [Saguinus oedipus]|uniref:Uncharacterized protein n=1 Tax=Saguinus oedipus TaxID=9490 RepID=A0ABQ9VQV7_SAGOE|nr:hypothetical protein P7K49_011277 [Saguinus oedipus]
MSRDGGASGKLAPLAAPDPPCPSLAPRAFPVSPGTTGQACIRPGRRAPMHLALRGKSADSEGKGPTRALTSLARPRRPVALATAAPVPPALGLGLRGAARLTRLQGYASPGRRRGDKCACAPGTERHHPCPMKASPAPSADRSRDSGSYWVPLP